MMHDHETRYEQHAKSVVTERIWRIETGQDFLERVVAYRFPEAPQPVAPVPTEIVPQEVTIEPTIESKTAASVLTLTDQNDRQAAARAELNAILENSGASHDNPYDSVTEVADDQKTV